MKLVLYHILTRGLNVVTGIEYTLQKLMNNVECKVDECNEFDAHQLKANITRERYSKDKEDNNKNSVTMSIDVRKVIMLSRIPGIKTAVSVLYDICTIGWWH